VPSFKLRERPTAPGPAGKKEGSAAISLSAPFFFLDSCDSPWHGVLRSRVVGREAEASLLPAFVLHAAKPLLQKGNRLWVKHLGVLRSKSRGVAPCAQGTFHSRHVCVPWKSSYWKLARTSRFTLQQTRRHLATVASLRRMRSLRSSWRGPSNGT